jgi:hypothetical protein
VFDVLKKKGTPSHYARRHRNNTVYLPHTLSVRIMYDEFLEQHDPEYAKERKEKRENFAPAPLSREPILSFS